MAVPDRCPVNRSISGFSSGGGQFEIRVRTPSRQPALDHHIRRTPLRSGSEHGELVDRLDRSGSLHGFLPDGWLVGHGASSVRTARPRVT
jgi:hypothetical protein